MNFETTMKRPNPNPRPELCRWSFHKKHSWRKQVKSSQVNKKCTPWWCHYSATCNNCTRGITMMPSPRLLLQCVYAYVRASYAAVIWAEWAVLSSSSSSTERRWCCNMKIVLGTNQTTTGYYEHCIWVNHDTIEVLRSNFVYVPYCITLNIHIDIKYGFSFFQSRIQNPTGEEKWNRPSIVRSQCKPYRKHKNHNHDANSTAANTTTTDAGDKTEHIIMTAMKYLVHLQDSRQSTHPSPFPFPYPCEPPPTHQHAWFEPPPPTHTPPSASASITYTSDKKEAKY